MSSCAPGVIMCPSRHYVSACADSGRPCTNGDGRTDGRNGRTETADAESEHPYLAFFETDSVWEPMDLPDVTVAFRSGRLADVCIAVCEDMLLPGADDLL